MSEHIITEATVNDVSVIRDLAEATWWPTYGAVLEASQIRYMLDELYSIKTLTHQIETCQQTYLLLKENYQAVAFAGYSVYEDNTLAYKLHKLYCLPQTQGKGYGKVLLDTVANIAAKSGASKLYLNVNRYNKALGFYLKLDFQIDHEIDIPFGPFVLNDYVMVKEL